MEKSIEVLLSVMNVKNKEEFYKILEKNNITGKVCAVNQVKNESDIWNLEDGDKRLYSYNELGASRSRNRLLEKAEGDICIFADDDMVYNNNYQEVILREYEKNKNAEMFIFNIKSTNINREKIKKIYGRKIKFLDTMRIRTSEITFKKEIIKKYNVKFDENFGPNGFFKKGDETIFVYDIYKKYCNVYNTKTSIGYVKHTESTWFEGYNEKYMYDQGAIFYRIARKMYKLLILQFAIRKYFLYKDNISIIEAYKQMVLGAKKCKEMYGEKNE